MRILSGHESTGAPGLLPFPILCCERILLTIIHSHTILKVLEVTLEFAFKKSILGDETSD